MISPHREIEKNNGTSELDTIIIRHNETVKKYANIN